MNDFRHDPPPDPPPQIVDVEHRAAVSEAPLPPAALKRPWWRKKRHMAWYLPLALVVFFAAVGGDPEPAPVEPATAVEEPAPEPEVEPVDEVPDIDPDPLGDVVIPEPEDEPELEVEPIDAEDVELPESMRREIAQLALQSTWDGMDSEEQASICVAMYLDEDAVLDAFMEGASDSDLKRKDARTFFQGAC